MNILHYAKFIKCNPCDFKFITRVILTSQSMPFSKRFIFRKGTIFIYRLKLFYDLPVSGLVGSDSLYDAVFS